MILIVAGFVHQRLVRNQMETRAWLRTFQAQLELIGLLVGLPPVIALHQALVRPQCPANFPSYQQLAAHRAARHGFRNLASFWVEELVA